MIKGLFAVTDGYNIPRPKLGIFAIHLQKFIPTGCIHTVGVITVTIRILQRAALDADLHLLTILLNHRPHHFLVMDASDNPSADVMLSGSSFQLFQPTKNHRDLLQPLDDMKCVLKDEFAGIFLDRFIGMIDAVDKLIGTHVLNFEVGRIGRLISAVETLHELNKTEEKKAADELRKLKDLEKIRKAFDERDRNFRYEPTCIGNMKFKWATRMALSVAENFQLNVTVERNDRCGIIQFLGDSILSEVIWKDGNYLRQLLILLRWADGVCIGTKDDYGDTIIYIYLTYKLAREKLIH